MTPRERFREALLFGTPDRVPLSPGSGRKSTREAWYAQGLPRDVPDINEYAYRQVGGAESWPSGGDGFPINEKMIPQFEEKVIERRERSQVVQDWKGNICEISNEFTPEYLRTAADFVTRRWIKCPVETREDWAEMKRRYDPDDPARFPENAEELGQRLAQRDWVLGLNPPGPFWQLREWLGFEKLCMLFLDDPAWTAEMIAFWEEFIARLLENTFKYFVPDYVIISEDMAFKSFPMISPAMAREFLLPTYRRWCEIILSSGCPVCSVDSDGYIRDLIPVWIEAGINRCEPVEVAAGNDLAELRRRFGRKMAYYGGVDKRAMARGGEVIEKEIARLTPVIEDGGYIPGCDHGIPPDVSWPNFLKYVELLSKATGWL